MFETPQVTDSEAQHAAVIPVKVPRSGIRDAMGAAIAELMGVMRAQGIIPSGALFAHHLRMDPEAFEFEVGVPVTEPVVPSGRVIAGELPARRVARAVYRGGYEGLHAAWGEFDQWVKAEGYTPAPDLWECYVSGPESGDDPTGWHTELNRPLLAD